jgi:tetratricopeptide (TPR) repeat protein
VTVLRRHLPACLGLLLVLALPAWGEERFALLIGANAGWANDRPLRHAETDAERVRDVLVELGGFPAERVLLLRDPETAEVRKALEQLSRTVRGLGEKESLVFFYYSGHADEQHLHLRGPSFSLGELYEGLRDLPATLRVGVLDACRSGSILTTKGGRRASAFEVRVMNELRARGLALLTSSGADELSQENRALAGGSVFTHHLVSGLRGAADANQDGEVWLSEAYQYALQRTEADTAPTAAPHRPAFHFELAGQGEPALTWPPRGAARLVLPRGEGERYVVVDESQLRLVAEGRTRPDEPVAFALAPGTYHVTHVRKQRLAVATLQVERGALVEAGGLAYVERPLSTGLLKGNPDRMDAEERTEWQRGEALRLLDDGKPEEALGLFEELLAQSPEDLGSRRGKARALVRLADAQGRAGQSQKEQETLSAAVEAEPSLVEDPDFASRYRKLREVEAEAQRSSRVREAVEQALERQPRKARRWGLGLNFIGPSGPMTPWAALLLGDNWTIRLTGAVFFSVAVDVGLHYSPGIARGGLFYGLGVNVPLAYWLPRLGPPQDGVFGPNLHMDVGWHFITMAGIAGNVGGALILFRDASANAFYVLPMFTLGGGWYF